MRFPIYQLVLVVIGANKNPCNLLDYRDLILKKYFNLLFHRLLDSNSYSNGSTYHWVVTHTEEAHHLNVSRNRRRTCKLSVRVHTTKGIGHTVRFLPYSRNICSSVIRKSPYINKIRTPQNSSRLRLGLKICLLSVNGRS